MSKREDIEKRIVQCCRLYEQSVSARNKKDTNEYRHDIQYLMAALLNTYMDVDDRIDWRGAWADRLADDTLNFDSQGIWRVYGLMVCSDRDARKMYLIPFNSKLVCPTDSVKPDSYVLRFAAEGPWETEGTDSVLPSMKGKDKELRQKLLDDWSKPDTRWATTYHSSSDQT